LSIIWPFCFRRSQRIPSARRKRDTRLRLSPRASANFLDLCLPTYRQQTNYHLTERDYLKGRQKRDIESLPGDVTREKERGPTLADPEHPSVELLPQINGLPATLH
jgi:hypothetical protein